VEKLPWQICNKMVAGADFKANILFNSSQDKISSSHDYDF